MAKQTPKKRNPLARKKGKPARSAKKSARASSRPLRDSNGRFKAKKPAKSRAGRTNGKSAFRPKGRTKEKVGSTPTPSTKKPLRQRAKVQHNTLRKKTGQSHKTRSKPSHVAVKPSKKLARPNKPKGKQTAKANIARPPEYEVTSSTERMITIHTELRQRAIEESRLLIPDGRTRKVEDQHGRKALKKEVAVTKFLTESNLETILYKVKAGLTQIEDMAHRKENVRYTLCLNLSEYGIKLYGSNKGVIARVDGLRSEALHWSKWSVPANPDPDGALAALEAGLDSFLDRKLATTVCIESVTVTALYGAQGRESGND